MLFELSAMVFPTGCVVQPATSIAATAIVISSRFIDQMPARGIGRWFDERWVPRCCLTASPVTVESLDASILLDKPSSFYGVKPDVRRAIR